MRFRMPATLWAGRFVHDHDNVGPQSRRQHLLAPSEEDLAIHRLVDERRCGDAGKGQSADEGERSLRRALSDYVERFHAERNHQVKGNVLLFPRAAARQREGPVRCRERLAGLLRYYHREAVRWRGGRSSSLTLRRQRDRAQDRAG
jgi:hypothetical protein